MSGTTERKEDCVDCTPPPTEAKEDLLDARTFIPPLKLGDQTSLPAPLVVIEYCQRCKFGLRANWFQQELLSTFSSEISSIMLIPKSDEPSAGRFRVYILPSLPAQQLDLVWDRKVEGGFPEMKVLKQKIRDVVKPDLGLGHSDKKP